jgi:hypothetical protein
MKLALAVPCGAALFTLDRRAGHARGLGLARYVEPFSRNTITAILAGVAGVSRRSWPARRCQLAAAPEA